jgi:hypothetical protein
MAIKPQDLIKYARTAPRVLKVIAIVAAVDLAILLLAALTLEDEVDDRVARAEQLKSELAGLRTKVETTRKEIARLPELRAKYDAAMADGVLSDQDRQKLVGHLQELVDRHRLSDLHYKLDAQQTTPGTATSYALVTTPVSLNLSGLLDSDVMEFWDEVFSGLQSHYQISKVTLERVDADSSTVLAAIRAGHPTALVRSELEFGWVSLRKPRASGAAAATPAAPAKTGMAAAPPAPQTTAEKENP